MKDDSRGRVKIWSCWMADADGISYPHIAQVACICREIYDRTGRKVNKEIALQITSSGPEKMSAADMNQHTREHWWIENKSHYVRDTVYREDHNQSWTGKRAAFTRGTSQSFHRATADERRQIHERNG